MFFSYLNILCRGWILSAIIYISILEAMEKNNVTLEIFDESAKPILIAIDRNLLSHSVVLDNLLTGTSSNDLPITLAHVSLELWEKTIYPALKILDSAVSNEEKNTLLVNLIQQQLQGKSSTEIISTYRKIINGADFLNIPQLFNLTIQSCAFYLGHNPEIALDVTVITELKMFHEHIQSLVCSLLPNNRILVTRNKTTLDKTRGGHDDCVTSVAFRAGNETILASASLDKTIKLWDIQDDPKLLETLDQTKNGHNNRVNTVIFNPQGTLLASGAADGTIKLWNTQNPRQPIPLVTIDQNMNGHTEEVRSVVFSPNGAILASGSDDRTIKLWDIQNPPTPILRATFDQTNGGHTNSVTTVAFDHHGTMLASGSVDMFVKLWNVRNLMQPQLISNISQDTLDDNNNSINSLVFSPREPTLITASKNKTLTFWNIYNPNSPQFIGLLGQATGSHNDIITSVAYNPKEPMFACGSFDQTIRIWSTQFPQHPYLLTIINRDQGGHSEKVNSVVFNSEGTLLASGGCDNAIKVWLLESNRLENLSQLMLFNGLIEYFKKSRRKFYIIYPIMIDTLKSLPKSIQDIIYQYVTIANY